MTACNCLKRLTSTDCEKMFASRTASTNVNSNYCNYTTTPYGSSYGSGSSFLYSPISSSYYHHTIHHGVEDGDSGIDNTESNVKELVNSKTNNSTSTSTFNEKKEETKSTTTPTTTNTTTANSKKVRPFHQRGHSLSFSTSSFISPLIHSLCCRYPYGGGQNFQSIKEGTRQDEWEERRTNDIMEKKEREENKAIHEEDTAATLTRPSMHQVSNEKGSKAQMKFKSGVHGAIQTFFDKAMNEEPVLISPVAVKPTPIKGLKATQSLSTITLSRDRHYNNETTNTPHPPSSLRSRDNWLDDEVEDEEAVVMNKTHPFSSTKSMLKHHISMPSVKKPTIITTPIPWMMNDQPQQQVKQQQTGDPAMIELLEIFAHRENIGECDDEDDEDKTKVMDEEDDEENIDDGYLFKYYSSSRSVNYHHDSEEEEWPYMQDFY